MVTVELAMGFAAVVLVLALGLTAIGVARARAELCEQVRISARAYSLGEVALAGLGDGTFSITDSGQTFTALGTKPALGLAGWEVGTIRCQLVGIREPIPWTLIGGAE